MDHVIPETPFTIDFVLEQIKNSKWHKDCDLKNLISYESKEIGKGVAFLSRIMRLNFSWNDPTIRPTSIVLKVPGIQDYKKLMPVNSSKEELEYLDDQAEMKQVAQELAEVQPEVFAPLLDRASPLYTYECYKKCCYVEDKYGFPAALVHSDLWAPNILFETDMYEPVLSLV
uniref:CHK kinase-like domain-containing protein n=1 Tax=Acrobeloides nanus TaxID=290746 RepID=A0A914C8A6_9BILA